MREAGIFLWIALLISLCTGDPIPDGECISDYTNLRPSTYQTVVKAQLNIKELLEKGFALADEKRATDIAELEAYETKQNLNPVFGYVLKRAKSRTVKLSSCQGLGLLETSLYTARSQSWTKEEADIALRTLNIPQKFVGHLIEKCWKNSYGITAPFHTSFEPSGQCLKNKYRSANGSCNNPNHLNWGASSEPFQRFIGPEYGDGVGTFREAQNNNRLLPNVRRVSLSLQNRPAPKKSTTVTQILKLWGQFLDHDITKTPETSAGLDDEGTPIDIPCCVEGKDLKIPFEDCRPILVPLKDSFYRNQSIECLRFVRSTPCAGSAVLQPREQLSENTAFIDGSNVYGSSQEEQTTLRSHSGGGLRIGSVIKADCTRTCPLHNLPERVKIDPDNLFVAGDDRVNEQPSLTSMHTIWVRLHNKIASILNNQTTEDDQIVFEETRRIVGAIMQHITYTEFLPVVLGKQFLAANGLSTPNKNLQDSQGYNTRYDIERNPTVFNAVGAAAFRFGHSLVSNDMKGKIPFALENNFFRGEIQNEEGTQPSDILEGEMFSAAEGMDAFLDFVLTNKLLTEDPFNHGTDLMSLNIMRGRDHGLPGYNKWRSFCHLRPFRSFYEMRFQLDPIVVDKFEALYDDVDDVDLFPAGLAETPTADGILGPTFSCLLLKQFENLKFGDRFWYENGPSIHTFNSKIAFTPNQLALLRKTSLASVLCQTTDIRFTPLRPMEVSGCSTESGNPVMACDQWTRGLIEALRNGDWREGLNHY